MARVPACECGEPAVIYVHYRRTRHHDFLCKACLFGEPFAHMDRAWSLDTPKARRTIAMIESLNPSRLVEAPRA